MIYVARNVVARNVSRNERESLIYPERKEDECGV